jgi:NitT/TauT family transport system permease protein
MIRLVLEPSQVSGKLRRPTYVLAAVIAFFLLVGAWSLVSALGLVTPILLPSPLDVLRAIVESFSGRSLTRDIAVSSYRVFGGWVLATLLAVPIGLLVGTYRIAEAMFEPLNDFVRYMPVVAFVPLCIVWFGIGDLQKLVIIFLGTFPQLVLMVSAAAARVPREYLECYFVLGGRRVGYLHKVILPAALPEILDALRIAAGWAWSYLVVAELVAADVGIGFKIMQSERFLQTAPMIAYIIVVGGLGIATDYLFKLLSRLLLPWTEKR